MGFTGLQLGGKFSPASLMHETVRLPSPYGTSGRESKIWLQGSLYGLKLPLRGTLEHHFHISRVISHEQLPNRHWSSLPKSPGQYVGQLKDRLGMIHTRDLINTVTIIWLNSHLGPLITSALLSTLPLAQPHVAIANRPALLGSPPQSVRTIGKKRTKFTK